MNYTTNLKKKKKKLCERDNSKNQNIKKFKNIGNKMKTMKF